MMKTLKLMLPVLALVALVAACGKGNEYHQTRFLRPGESALYVFADQQRDSVSFVSTESYVLSSNVSWCEVANGYESLNIPYSNALVDCYAWLEFEANTTGEQRGGILHLGAGDYSIDAYFVQLPYLCVTSPSRFSQELLPLTCEATAEQATLKFKVFATWTLALEEEADWLQLEKTAGSEGEQEVGLTLQPNTTTEDRTATLILTSRGVTEKITIIQNKPITEE